MPVKAKKHLDMENKTEEDIPEFIYKPRKKKEVDIESKVCKRAIENGWEVYKFNCDNRVGVPDRLFIRYGVCMFIEFKKPKSDLREKQVEQRDILIQHGIPTFKCDNVELGYKLVA